MEAAALKKLSVEANALASDFESRLPQSLPAQSWWDWLLGRPAPLPPPIRVKHGEVTKLVNNLISCGNLLANYNPSQVSRDAVLVARTLADRQNSDQELAVDHVRRVVKSLREVHVAVEAWIRDIVNSPVPTTNPEF